MKTIHKEKKYQLELEALEKKMLQPNIDIKDWTEVARKRAAIQSILSMMNREFESKTVLKTA